MDEIRVHIKQRLQIRNMKQVDLAEKTGIDKGQISSYISGKYKPKQENLTLMAVALNVSEYWLMGLDVPMEREESSAVAEQKQRFEAYVIGLYEMREPEMILELYEQLSEENRAKVKVYMERLLAGQKMEIEDQRL